MGRRVLTSMCRSPGRATAATASPGTAATAATSTTSRCPRARPSRAGNGGTGRHGGAGGSPSRGNGVAHRLRHLHPSRVSLLDRAIGGNGSTGGWPAGGSITNWDSVFLDFDRHAARAGSLIYASGSGGSAAAGPGGNGGSITNSSPDVNQNNLSGDLHLQTGSGGNGLDRRRRRRDHHVHQHPTNESAVAAQLSVAHRQRRHRRQRHGRLGRRDHQVRSPTPRVSSSSPGDLVGIGRVIAGDGGASYGGAGRRRRHDHEHHGADHLHAASSWRQARAATG